MPMATDLVFLYLAATRKAFGSEEIPQTQQLTDDL
jgi:hypothetical protein